VQSVVALAGSTTELQAVKPVVKIGRARRLEWIVVDSRQEYCSCAANRRCQILENIHPQYRPVQFRFLVRDTHLDPSRALEAIRGPRSTRREDRYRTAIQLGSGDDPAICRRTHILVISQGSTASVARHPW